MSSSSSAPTDRRQPTRLRLALNVEAQGLLERFLVASIAAVIGIRLYLELTNYPQVGGGGLHIAHMLWGGLLMLVAIVISLAFLGYKVRQMAAIIGGFGFGTFIDELGKFITADNNYFFRPTIALIYVIFVLLFFAFQSIDDLIPISPRSALASAVGAVEEGVIRGFSEERRARTLRLLDQSDPSDPLVQSLRHTMTRITPEPPAVAGLIARVTGGARRHYDLIVGQRWFLRIIIGFFILNAIVAIAALIFRIISDPHFSASDLSLSFVDTVTGLGTTIGDGMVIIGVATLRASRQLAFRWFKRSVLVTLFLIQPFWFYTNERTALIWLVLSLILLRALNFAISREAASHPPAAAPAPSPRPAAAPS